HLSERRWFAVRTSSKHEKKAGEELSRLGVEHFIPLREKVYHYPSKKVVRQLPLLTGYVFVRICKGEELKVIQAHYVSSFVTLGKERRCVTNEELDLLRKLSTDRNLDWETIDDFFDFSEGTPVEIIKGPLAGTRGYYLEKKNKKTFLISLGSLNACLATCEVDPQFLVALDGERNAPPKGTNEEGKKTLW
ncbi:MAG: UpxY family transcription antiterminator, partial [Bacteroidota bacterium]